MIVLGIHVGHDSSAAIIVNGEIMADVSEERFNRIKHSNNVPLRSIQYCLEKVGLKDINCVDYIAFSWKSAPPQIVNLFGLDVSHARKGVIERVRRLSGRNRVKMPVYYDNYNLDDPNKFIPVEHHLAHAASAFYTKGSSEKCLVFTIDGSGDGVSTAVWEAEGTSIEPLVKYYKEASLGWSYSIATEGLHYWHGDGEGTVMGLAPYGDPGKCKGVLDKYFPHFDGKELIKKAEMGNAYYWAESGFTHYHFDEAYEVEKLVEKYGAENIAAEAQRKLEENIISFVKGWCKEKNISSIACAGGVFLNVKLNQRIWNARDGIIKSQSIFPNSGDSGLAVGAALHVYHRHNEYSSDPIDHLFLGPEYSDKEIEALLKSRMLDYEVLENPARTAAEILAENKVIGWFQGRMESGPRALGNRSILMSPLKPENKDYVNARVKFREGFRPFCPSLLWEKREEYLKDYRDEYYMITSFEVKDEKRNKVPAVVHVDNTLRPQMVKEKQNPLYWNLINEFGNITGEYIVLNTSLNIKGEPMICAPREALRCFFDSGLDALILGRYLLKKSAVIDKNAPSGEG